MPIEHCSTEQQSHDASHGCRLRRWKTHNLPAAALLIILFCCTSDCFQATHQRHIHSRASTKHTVPLHVVDTKEAHDVDLKTPFHSVVVPNIGRNNTMTFRDEELLLPAFLVQPEVMNMDASSDDEQETTASAAHDTENSKEENETPNEEETKRKRIDQTAKAAALLSKKKLTVNRSSAKPKNTSVGARRVGSATTARNSGRSVTKLVDAVRTASSTTSTQKDDSNNNNMKTQRTGSDPSTRRMMIDSTVEEMMTKRSSTHDMGILGEAIPQPLAPKVLPRPKPGTVLMKSKRTLSSYTTNSEKSLIDVRVATPSDDLDIANLRLSVFSDFTPETRRLFCDRSCHLLSTRRQRGAMCLVAVEPQRSMLLSPSGSIKRDPVVGTAEISFHEFADTRLGRSRHEDKILYVTEVAVNSQYRRQGIAKLMMKAIDKVASIRNIETIFLHVDVENQAALRLYENAGFRKLPSDNPAFYEFTRKLNLHDGATKGRRHFLMCKDLKPPTWLQDIFKEEPAHTHRGNLGIEILP
jgi:ribosomal protein S18 acetylase RimI-like enzyme